MTDLSPEEEASVQLIVSTIIRRTKMTGIWQPIETAPRDGVDVLAFSPIDGVHIRPGDGEWWSLNKDLISVPTHWMPLPEPPQ